MEVSKELHYLLIAHLLTVTKTFTINRKGDEVSTINHDQLRQKFSKSCSLHNVQEIVTLAKEYLASESAAVIFDLSKSKCSRTITPSDAKLNTFPLFTSFKAILAACKTEGIPIRVKPFKETGGNVCFLGEVPKTPGTPVLDVEVFYKSSLSTEEIEKIGLKSLLLANGALPGQFTVDDDLSSLEETEREELLRYRQMGNEYHCYDDNPSYFKIAHVHAGVFRG